MKSLRFFFIAYLYISSGYAQSTDDIYLDEYGLRITKEEYNALSDNNVGYFYLEGITESGKVYFVEKRVTTGIVSLQVVKDLRAHLQNLSQSEINKNNYLVVNYFPGADPCNQSGNKKAYNSNLESFQKRIKKQKEVSQFFIYKNIEGLEDIKGSLSWYPDENNLWQSHFFRHHYPCGSYVIIRPDGHFFITKGEYNSRIIFKKLKELKRLD